MQFYHKRMHVLLIFRNLTICLVSIAVVLFGIEILFSKSDKSMLHGKSKLEFELQDEENQNIELMQIEQMNPFDFLFGLGTNKAHKEIYESVYHSLSETQIQDLESDRGHFPHISYMQQEDVYDEDTVHIVVLGDSFTWGEASINRNEIYWRLLETSMRAQGYNVRVSGVAMINASSFDELRWLMQTDLFEKLEPDILVFGYLFNDPEWYNYLADKEDYLFSSGIVTPIHLKPEHLLSVLGHIFPSITSRVKNTIYSKIMYSVDGNSIFDDDFYAPLLKEENLQRFENDFMAPLDTFAVRRRIPVVLMPLAFFQGEMLTQKLYEPLHRLCKTYNNIHLYDTTHDFFHGFDAPQHRNNYYINCANLHPGSSMSYFYAQFMENYLKKDFADVLGEPVRKIKKYPFSVNEALPPKCLRSVRKESDAVITLELDYPALKQSHRLGEFTVKDYLWFPLEKDSVALSFMQPVDLSQIEVKGEKIENLEIYYRCINETLRYDDHTVKPFGVQNGMLWTDDTPDRVTTLLIHADITDGQNANLTLTIAANEREGA